MTISVEIDDKLVQDGLEFGEQKTKETLVSEAVKEYVSKRARRRLIAAFGTFDYDADYDPKAHR